MTNRSNPTILEKMMSVALLVCLVSKLISKWETNTLIFIFNPCHQVSVSEEGDKSTPKKDKS